MFGLSFLGTAVSAAGVGVAVDSVKGSWKYAAMAVGLVAIIAMVESTRQKHAAASKTQSAAA
jgi:hypothetical protein